MKHALLMLLCYLAVCMMPCKADVIQTEGTYSFPMKPSDETWKTHETAKDLKDALQIPSDVIKLISTANKSRDIDLYRRLEAGSLHRHGSCRERSDDKEDFSKVK